MPFPAPDQLQLCSSGNRAEALPRGPRGPCTQTSGPQASRPARGPAGTCLGPGTRTLLLPQGPAGSQVLDQACGSRGRTPAHPPGESRRGWLQAQEAGILRVSRAAINAPQAPRGLGRLPGGGGLAGPGHRGWGSQQVEVDGARGPGQGGVVGYRLGVPSCG